MTTILIKKKDTAGAPAAGDLTNAAGGAEIAVNTATKRLYTKDSGGNVVEIGTNPSAITTNLLFSPDNTYDIGASGASRPRNMFLGSNLTVGGNSSLGGTLGVTGLATFSADNAAAIFQGATQGNINIQKTGTSGYGLFSDGAGILGIYNNNSAVTTARFNSTGLIVGGSVGTQTANADLNIYNNNANGELLRMEGLGNRTGWNGFSFWTAGVANRHARFTQSGTSTKIAPYETSTGNLATDGSLDIAYNYFNVYNYDSTTPILVATTSGVGVGTANLQSVTGGKALSLGAYLNLFSFSAGIGGMNQNAYYDGAWRFTTANYSTIYQSDVGTGQHIWYSSTTAGSIGSAISYVQLMTLNRDSRLIVGTGTTFGNQALTTPGINIGSNATGQGLSITNADGASSATDARMLIGNGSSTYGALRMVFNSTASVSMDAVTWGSTAVTKDLSINVNGGSVGVGLQTPSTYGKFAVGTGTISLVTDTSSQRRLNFWSTANGNSENGYIQVQNDGATTNTGEMLFATRNAGGTLAERGRFTAPGQFLVGTTTNVASGQLEVVSTLAGPALFARAPGDITNQQGQALVLSDATVTALRTNFIVQRIGSRGGLGIGSTEVGVTNDRDIYLGYTGGIVALGGGTTVNTSGGALQLTSGSYGGITFPATQVTSSNANTLDDYEEGTFTPTFNTTNNDLANFSYSVQYGRYTKVGNTVQAFISLATVNAASISGSGDVVINGLPFVVANQSNGVNALALTHDQRWVTNPSFAQCQRTTTSVTLFKNSLMAAGGSSALQRTDFNATNGGNFNIVTIMFIYFVD